MSRQYQRAKELFLRVCELDPEERRVVLDAECGDDAALRADVESLLRHADPVEDPTLADPTPPPGTPPRQAPPGTPGGPVDEPGPVAGDGNGHPDRIGPYRVIRGIGHGGMGVVYLAERADGGKGGFVALKVIHRGMETEEVLRRFQQERFVLDALDHPSIARLQDAGRTDDGLPYFALEYIEGVPIDKYCDDNRLSIRQRLGLFRDVCEAVHHAHQNLVVHRDLKPGHVLISRDGKPKLLDFGIAKLLNPQLSPLPAYPTLPGRGFMTPEYASPEQVRGGAVAVTSDVYSLGVILYELLTGHRPYRFKNRNDPTEVAGVVGGSVPLRPSAAVSRSEEILIDPETGTTERITPERVSGPREGRPDRLRRRLAGDIDNIVLKALRKEPEQRYGSAQQFSEDIQRHITGMPVIARPDSLAYRAAKFVRRNRAGVAAAATAALALILGMTTTTLAMQEANRQRGRAEKMYEAVDTVADEFLIELYDRFRFLDGTHEARRLLVETLVDVYGGLVEGGNPDPELREVLASGYNRLGNVTGSFREPGGADFRGALVLHRLATDHWQALCQASPRDGKLRLRLATGHIYTGDALKHTGELTGAIGEFDAALNELARVTTPEPRRHRAAALRSQGRIFEEMGRLADAEAKYREALRVTEALVEDDPRELHRRSHAVSWIAVGNGRRTAGAYEEALAAYEEAISLRERRFRDAEPSDAKARDALAKARYAAGLVLVDMHDVQRAAELLEQAHRTFLEAAEANPNDVSDQLDLARSFLALGRLDLETAAPEDALAALTNAEAILEDAVLVSDATNVREALARVRRRIGEAEAARGNTTTALAELRRAVQIVQRLLERSPQSFTLEILEAELRLAIGTALLTGQRRNEADEALAAAGDQFENLDRSGPGYAAVRDGLKAARYEQSILAGNAPGDT